MSTKLNIEQLFTSKLEGLEQTPSASVWKQTSRIVRRNQFLRFNYRRFNIYYAAGLIILGAALTYLLISVVDHDYQTPGTDLQETSDQLQNEMSEQERDKALNEYDLLPNDLSEGDKNSLNHPANSSEDGGQKSGITEQADTEQPRSKPDDKDKSGTSKNNQSLAPVSTLVPYFIPSVYEGCAPLTVELRSASINAANISWNFGILNPGSDSTVPVVTYPTPGTYTVTMTAMDQSGIQKSHSETIIVHPKPLAAFEIDQGSIYNYSIDAIEFEWYLASMNEGILNTSKVQPLSTNFQPSLSQVIENGKINKLVDPTLILFVKNSFGCIDSTSSTLPEGIDPELVFPTAFNPNPNGSIGGYYNPNDPDNQVFHPNFEEVPESYYLRIFNKTGALVFETTDIYIGWDGYYQEARAPKGVYIYYCTGTWKNGQPFQYRGDITILWNDQ